MAFEKRFKNDYVMIKNFEDFINALFVGDLPCDLINSTTTKVQFLKHFAGPNYESFDDFDRDIKNNKKRANKKLKVFEFLKNNNLEMHPHSSYSIFLNDKKAEYEKKNPTMSLKDLKTLMTNEWTKMNTKNKEVFENIYQTKKQEFIDKVKEIDPSFIVYFDKSQAPKPKPQPYPTFVKEQMKIIKAENNQLMSKEIMKIVGQKWKVLELKDKKKYYDMCNAEMPAPKKVTSTKSESEVKNDNEKEKEKEKEKQKEKKKEKEKEKEKEKKPTITKPKSTKNESDIESETEVKKTKGKDKKPTATKAKQVKNDSEIDSEVEVKKEKKPAPAATKTKSAKNESDNESEVEIKTTTKTKTPQKKKFVETSEDESNIDTILDDEDE
jgi:hydrocephalus-inducing protein